MKATASHSILYHLQQPSAAADTGGATTTTSYTKKEETTRMRKSREFCEKFQAISSTQLLVYQVVLRAEHLPLVPVTNRQEEGGGGESQDNNSDNTTRLESICGVAVADISLKSLEKFCVYQKITGYARKTKKEVADIIVAWKIKNHPTTPDDNNNNNDGAKNATHPHGLAVAATMTKPLSVPETTQTGNNAPPPMLDLTDDPKELSGPAGNTKGMESNNKLEQQQQQDPIKEVAECLASCRAMNKSASTAAIVTYHPLVNMLQHNNKTRHKGWLRGCTSFGTTISSLNPKELRVLNTLLLVLSAAMVPNMTQEERRNLVAFAFKIVPSRMNNYCKNFFTVTGMEAFLDPYPPPITTPNKKRSLPVVETRAAATKKRRLDDEIAQAATISRAISTLREACLHVENDTEEEVVHNAPSTTKQAACSSMEEQPHDFGAQDDHQAVMADCCTGTATDNAEASTLESVRTALLLLESETVADCCTGTATKNAETSTSEPARTARLLLESETVADGDDDDYIEAAEKDDAGVANLSFAMDHETTIAKNSDGITIPEKAAKPQKPPPPPPPSALAVITPDMSIVERHLDADGTPGILLQTLVQRVLTLLVNKKTRIANLKYIDKSQRKVYFLAVFLAPTMHRNRTSTNPERQYQKRISHRALELKHFLEHLACGDKDDLVAFVGHWVRNYTNHMIAPKPIKPKRMSTKKKVDDFENELHDDYELEDGDGGIDAEI